MKSELSLVIATIALVHSTCSCIEAAPDTAAAIPTGNTIALISASRFGLFLPLKSGGGGVETVGIAVAFTSTPIRSAPNAITLLPGFIKSVYFERNLPKSYVQITGRFDRRTT
ncbi:hypothetical protein BGZ81_000298 [Podila clonocystis]|nr:hypothetical protein BGZ81_000298 [Podila clonocystis]